MNSRRDKKRANLRDVARAANVSVATVSRVLNSPAIVQQDTRLRVETAITELGFHPSAAARAINSGRSKIFGALIPSLDNDTFALTIEAIERRLGQFGFSLVVATTAEVPEQEVQRAKELLDIGVEGLFLPGISHEAALYDLLARRRVPAIAISYFDPGFSYPTIGYDNRKAARLALDHLFELGHQRIAVVHGPKIHNDRTRERIAGASEHRKDVALTFLETELSVAGGATVVAQAMAEKWSFDAYLCVSDVLAFGVLFELQRYGVAVPDVVSVIGIHDLPSSQMTTPRLSTVHLPAEEMGRHAAEALAQWVEDDVVPDAVCFECKLVARETTARKTAVTNSKSASTAPKHPTKDA